MAWVMHGSRSGRGHPVAPVSACDVRLAPVAGPLLPAILAIAAVSSLIAILFTLAGAWLVLPFAGLELAALGWALHASLHRPANAVRPAPAFHFARRSAAGRMRRQPATRIRMINLRRKPF